MLSLSCPDPVLICCPDVVLAAENQPVPSSAYQHSVESVITQLTDAEKAVDAILKGLTGAAAGGPARASQTGVADGGRAGAGGADGAGGAGAGGAEEEVLGDASFLADEIAEQLRARLKELAKQVADLQVRVF